MAIFNIDDNLLTIIEIKNNTKLIVFDPDSPDDVKHKNATMTQVVNKLTNDFTIISDFEALEIRVTTAEDDIDDNTSAIVVNTSNILNNFNAIAANIIAIVLNTAKETNVTTNLSLSNTTLTTTIISSDGTNAVIPAVTSLKSGVMTTTQKDKLDGIAVNANLYILPVAAGSIGGVKSGTDITIDGSGNVSVVDDSHNHIISNVDGLQTALNTKASLTGTETLTNKTLTSPVINSGDINNPDIDGGTVNGITSLTVVNNVDIGNYQIRARQFYSDVATGTAPFIIASTTKVTNLNADLLDGLDSTYLRNATNLNAGTVNDARLPATISSNITGNSATATKLATARTIDITGDITATAVAFDGTANIAISASVNDDSHNHIISNVDGLQTALNGKLPLSGGTLTGDLVILKPDTEIALLSLYSSSQGTGQIFVGQSPLYGGGIVYNGDDNPDLPFTVDTISFYRRTGGVDHEVFYYSHGSDVVTFLGDVTAPLFISDVPTGTAPFIVASTTKVTNLNADLLDGLDSTAFVRNTGNETIAGIKTFSSTPIIPANPVGSGDTGAVRGNDVYDFTYSRAVIDSKIGSAGLPSNTFQSTSMTQNELFNMLSAEIPSVGNEITIVCNLHKYTSLNILEIYNINNIKRTSTTQMVLEGIKTAFTFGAFDSSILSTHDNLVINNGSSTVLGTMAITW